MYDRHSHPIKDNKPQPQPRAAKLAPKNGPRFADLLKVQRTAGNRAACSTLMRDPVGPMSPVTGDAVTGRSEVDVSMKDDALLAHTIVQDEYEILNQWHGALEMFDKTMVAASQTRLAGPTSRRPR